MNKSPLRRTFGKFKQKIFDEWPYCYTQIKSKRLARTADKLLADLPKLICDGEGRFEIHMLCGERQVGMATWASWSLLRFLYPSQLWVHSDGTITEESMEKWKDVIAGVQFVNASAGNRAWNQISTGGFPNLDEFRCSCYAARKLTDFHLFGTSEKILILDSDVLCFKRPEEIFRLFCTERRVFAFNAGKSGTAYMAESKEIERITGITPPDRFNSGFVVLSRFTQDDYLRLEDFMQRLRSKGIDNWSHIWAEQTLYGIAAGFSGISEALPNTYQVSGGNKCSDTIVRHYVGVPSIRPRFYTEGIREILINSFKYDNASTCETSR